MLKRIKIGMVPHPGQMKEVSGIATVIKTYDRLFPEYGMEIVPFDNPHDVSIIHAGIGHKGCDISMLHGLYWTADYTAASYEWRSNEHIVASVRTARYVTVPSPWVAETIRRDFRIDPVIIPHGVFAEDWVNDFVYEPNTVFWGKNRIYMDVCDPRFLLLVAERMPDITFYTTLAQGNIPENVKVIGLTPHEEMPRLLGRMACVMSTVKETWGILYAEALASGVPVVTVDKGHVPELIKYNVAGITYRSNDIDDAVRSIRWTLKHRDTLSKNAVRLAGKLTWNEAVLKIRRLAELIIHEKETGETIVPIYA